MLVHQRQSRIAEKKLRHDQQPNVFFTIQGLLEDVASVAIGCKFDHSTPVGVFFFLQYVKINEKGARTNLIQPTILRRSSAVAAASRHL
jgi:hypothetical protein